MTSHDRIRPIPERLIQARRKAGFSTGTAAQALHLTRAGISQYETGKSSPAWPILRMIALTYGTSVEWLCGDTDDPAPDQMLLDIDDAQSGRLLSCFRKLSDADRTLITDLARRLADGTAE